VNNGDLAQFPGWPITVNMADNDGRKPAGWLPELEIQGASSAVTQVVEESTGDILYTVRIVGGRFQPPVYSQGKYTLNVGRDKPDGESTTGLEAKDKTSAGKRAVQL
jgi:hypothetical protein